MADRTTKLRDLRRLLAKYNVWEDSSRGKGSHTMFFRVLDAGTVSFPIPTHNPEILKVYVRNCRRKFKLTAEDGVEDEDFYRG